MLKSTSFSGWTTRKGAVLTAEAVEHTKQRQCLTVIPLIVSTGLWPAGIDWPAGVPTVLRYQTSRIAWTVSGFEKAAACCSEVACLSVYTAVAGSALSSDCTSL